MQQSAHNSSWAASPSFRLYYGIMMAVIGSFGCGLEIGDLARILHESDSALASQYRLISFTAVMFGIIATFGIQAILRSVREIRAGL
jgi:hypothetical protein